MFSCIVYIVYTYMLVYEQSPLLHAICTCLTCMRKSFAKYKCSVVVLYRIAFEWERWILNENRPKNDENGFFAFDKHSFKVLNMEQHVIGTKFYSNVSQSSRIHKFTNTYFGVQRRTVNRHQLYCLTSMHSIFVAKQFTSFSIFQPFFFLLK